MRIYSKALLQALKECKRSKIYSLPVLNHYLMKVECNKTSIYSTNLETSLHAECESFSDDSFSVCVPMVSSYTWYESSTYGWKGKEHKAKAYIFYDLVKIHAETNDLLEITYKPFTCEIQIRIVIDGITSTRSTSTIKCLDALEFPPMEGK